MRILIPARVDEVGLGSGGEFYARLTFDSGEHYFRVTEEQCRELGARLYLAVEVFIVVPETPHVSVGPALDPTSATAKPE